MGIERHHWIGSPCVKRVFLYNSMNERTKPNLTKKKPYWPISLCVRPTILLLLRDLVFLEKNERLMPSITDYDNLSSPSSFTLHFDRVTAHIKRYLAPNNPLGVTVEFDGTATNAGSSLTSTTAHVSGLFSNNSLLPNANSRFSFNPSHNANTSPAPTDVALNVPLQALTPRIS